MLGSLLKDILFSPKRPSNLIAAQTTFERIEQKEGGTILCFSLGSEGDALKELIYWGVAPLRDEASEIVVLDMREKDFLARLSILTKKPIWFAAGHFGAGQEINVEIDGALRNLWEYFGIPFLRIFGDYPPYFPDAHVRHYRNSINHYFDQVQIDFYRRWFRNRAACMTLPPYCFDPMPLDKVDTKAKLSGKIVFPKNGNSPARLREYWRTALPSAICMGLESIAEDCTAVGQINRWPGLDDRLLDYYGQRGLDLEAEPATLCFMAAQLDDYLRRVKSTMIAEAILDLPVVIRGKLWDHVDFRGKRAVHDTDSDYYRTGPVIDQAPAIIDMSPNTVAVPHDRISRAMGRNTAFITNMQDFLRNSFERPERFAFEFDPESIRSCVEYYVDHPQEAVELGLEQTRRFRELYPEKKYADMLRSAVQLCAFRLAGRPAGTQNFVVFPPQFL